MLRTCIFLLCFFSANAFANYYCTGKVAYLGVEGNLYVSNGFGIHKLCSISEERCKAWFSMAMTAKVSDKKISIYYKNSTISSIQNDGACKDIGNWVTPSDAPYHINLH